MITDINSEDRLVQQTFAEHLEKVLGWESVYAYNAETFGPNGTLGRMSERDVVEVHRRATSQAAEMFLATLRARFPFRVRALQIDGGSEFKAFFEKACQRLRISLYLLPPRSPKLNAYVERANGTHRQEFYECVADCPWEVTELNRRLREWEYVYNHVRPHQALNYLTPAEYLTQHQPKGSPSHM